MSVIGEYDDEVLERRKRTIHLVEDRTAGISAWHGGTKVADLGGWTTVTRAIPEALAAAKRFGVTPSSSMRIRVCETVRHSWHVLRGVDSWGDPNYENTFVRQPVVALRRHAWDDVAGIIAPLWRPWTFHAEEWIGLREDPPEPSAIGAAYEGVDVGVVDERDLYQLHGVGLPVMTGVEVVPMAPPPFIRDQKERGVLSYLRVRVSGTCPVTRAPGLGDEATRAFLSKVSVRAVGARGDKGLYDRLLRRHVVWVDPEDSGSGWNPAIPALATTDA